MDPEVRVGTSGWSYASWRGRLYPPDLPQHRWLAHYATAFDTVEINASFYRLPSEETFRAWGEAVPDGFRFAVKGSRYVTHFERLHDVGDSVARFAGRARALGDRLGPVLWQLRPDQAVDLDLLDAFLAVLPRDLDHAIEPRHPSWFADPVRDRLAAASVALVAWDMHGEVHADPPTAPFAYLRFHGPTGSYGGSYDEELLRPWVRRIAAWLVAGHAVWAYFNNDADGHAVEDARRLRALLGGAPP